MADSPGDGTREGPARSGTHDVFTVPTSHTRAGPLRPGGVKGALDVTAVGIRSRSLARFHTGTAPRTSTRATRLTL